MDISEIRRKNLRRVVEMRGGASEVGKALGHANGATVSQLCGLSRDRLRETHVRNLSERSARQYEERLELPIGYLDQVETANDEAGPRIDKDLASNAIMAAAEAIEAAGLQMSPTKIAKIATFVYRDAVRTGQIRRDYIAEVIELFS